GKYGDPDAADARAHQSEPGGSEISDVRSADRRPIHPGTPDCEVGDIVRRAGAAAGDRRDLRRDRLYRSAADERNRHSYGAGREALQSDRDGNAGNDDTGCFWVGYRGSSNVSVVAGVRGLALRGR